MSDGRFAILDPAAWISGDMLLGALIAAGARPEWLRELPARLGFPEVKIETRSVQRCGVQAIKVDVVLPGEVQELPSTPVESPHEHHDEGPTHHAGGHRHIADLIQIVERADLSDWVRERALQAFRLLAEAEGRVHGMPAEAVSLRSWRG